MVRSAIWASGNSRRNCDSSSCRSSLYVIWSKLMTCGFADDAAVLTADPDSGPASPPPLVSAGGAAQPMLNFKSFQAAKYVLAGIELLHMFRKWQFMPEGCNEISFAD